MPHIAAEGHPGVQVPPSPMDRLPRPRHRAVHLDHHTPAVAPSVSQRPTRAVVESGSVHHHPLSVRPHPRRGLTRQHQHTAAQTRRTRQHVHPASRRRCCHNHRLERTPDPVSCPSAGSAVRDRRRYHKATERRPARPVRGRTAKPLPSLPHYNPPPHAPGPVRAPRPACAPPQHNPQIRVVHDTSFKAATNAANRSSAVPSSPPSTGAAGRRAGHLDHHRPQSRRSRRTPTRILWS